MDRPSQTPVGRIRQIFQSIARACFLILEKDRHRAPLSPPLSLSPSSLVRSPPRNRVRGSSVRYWLRQGQLVPFLKHLRDSTGTRWALKGRLFLRKGEGKGEGFQSNCAQHTSIPSPQSSPLLQVERRERF